MRHLPAPCLSAGTRWRASTTASSSAEQPPWPRLGVMGCAASPATLTHPRPTAPATHLHAYACMPARPTQRVKHHPTTRSSLEGMRRGGRLRRTYWLRSMPCSLRANRCTSAAAWCCSRHSAAHPPVCHACEGDVLRWGGGDHVLHLHACTHGAWSCQILPLKMEHGAWQAQSTVVVQWPGRRAPMRKGVKAPRPAVLHCSACMECNAGCWCMSRRIDGNSFPHARS